MSNTPLHIEYSYSTYCQGGKDCRSASIYVGAKPVLDGKWLSQQQRSVAEVLLEAKADAEALASRHPGSTVAPRRACLVLMDMLNNDTACQCGLHKTPGDVLCPHCEEAIRSDGREWLAETQAALLALPASEANYNEQLTKYLWARDTVLFDAGGLYVDEQDLKAEVGAQ